MARITWKKTDIVLPNTDELSGEGTSSGGDGELEKNENDSKALHSDSSSGSDSGVNFLGYFAGRQKKSDSRKHKSQGHSSPDINNTNNSQIPTFDWIPLVSEAIDEFLKSNPNDPYEQERYYHLSLAYAMLNLEEYSKISFFKAIFDKQGKIFHNGNNGEKNGENQEDNRGGTTNPLSNFHGYVSGYSSGYVGGNIVGQVYGGYAGGRHSGEFIERFKNEPVFSKMREKDWYKNLDSDTVFM